jgi:transcription elongation factor GreA
MCNKIISKEMFDYLSRHIEEIEKEKETLLKEYYSENAEECMNVGDFFREYTNSINGYLNGTRIKSDCADGCPFVIIRSIVEVQDIDDMETYQYCIVPPYANAADVDIDCASCLSPLGKSLLLKRVNQQVSVQIPTGELRYVIKKITLPKTVDTGIKIS